MKTNRAKMNQQQTACRDPKIILQQIVCENDDSRKWTATCRCGWWRSPTTKKECALAIDEHGGQNEEHLMTGPEIITTKSVIHVPRVEFPSDRWNWSAHNEDEDGEPWYHGTGRSEREAIEDLHHIDEVRRMARWHQSDGFPRNAAWLEFFRYTDQAA